MILKKDWISDFEILELYEQVNCEEYEQKPPTRIETQNPENQNNTDPNTTKPMLMQEYNKFKVNEENHD